MRSKGLLGGLFNVLPTPLEERPLRRPLSLRGDFRGDLCQAVLHGSLHGAANLKVEKARVSHKAPKSPKK